MFHAMCRLRFLIYLHLQPEISNLVPVSIGAVTDVTIALLWQSTQQRVTESSSKCDITPADTYLLCLCIVVCCICTWAQEAARWPGGTD